mmetsp:Transcript_8527/g.12145  ORF Transcript_8527/g.12145 Transcript_8527/m.12145 type:complete len:324 (-) Transcript_8527:185-1156(-)|eukprot:CAMPEP_0184854920 /NCGR_PEP_ID=MMETSP0580-20130426/291_1 /TAXON_ID=1118495 /ORGANISM="Dactyliosolen fragilissimus" /LENGTH=323 /DNA_ID=CAMNT_0027349295 /DNA_START=206 /DNA_END=1177 /DNA_ORIENTATION=+
MRLSSTSLLLFVTVTSTTSGAFLISPSAQRSIRINKPSFNNNDNKPTILKGYLDDLSSDLYQEDATPDVEKDSAEYNKMAKDQIDRYGPGNLADFVDFDEFDGGDGQMGVAGDGQKGLDKKEFESATVVDMNKSKMRSAKNAWGTSTGYADELIQKTGMDTARAQQLENWANQREVVAKNQQLKFMTEEFDQIEANAEADWRTLGSFGVERNEEFDLDEEFGPVVAGDTLEGTYELTARPNGGAQTVDLPIKNPYMGFADFRMAFTPETPLCWSVTPNEGSLSKTATDFVIKFRPENIGVFEGYLVLQTEDLKMTWKVVGSTG